MHTLHKVAYIFVIIGALNWGLVGAFNFNLVTYLFGQFAPFVEQWVYVAVGAAAVISLGTHHMTCVPCGADMGMDHGSGKKKSKKKKK